MEERIRHKTERHGHSHGHSQERTEHSRYANAHLGPHEESLVHILTNVASKLNLDQTLAKKLNVVENDKERGVNPYLSRKSSAQNTANPKPFTDNKQQNKSQKIRYRSQSVDYESVGGIFDIDLDDENAFDSISYSDEEEDDSMAFRHNTNDYNNSYNNRRTVTTNAHNGHNAQTADQMSVAYSLPIQVPNTNQHNHYDDTDDDDVTTESPNGETIAESIKKLAKSVRNETEIFGDRPRRRTNTFGDLIKSRPL